MATSLPDEQTQINGLKPFCQKRKLDSDVCSAAYTATMISDAMHKAGYSAKDTISLISKTGPLGQMAYEKPGLGGLTGPLISLVIVDGGPEYLLFCEAVTVTVFSENGKKVLIDINKMSVVQAARKALGCLIEMNLASPRLRMCFNPMISLSKLMRHIKVGLYNIATSYGDSP